MVAGISVCSLRKSARAGNVLAMYECALESEEPAEQALDELEAVCS